MDVRWMAKWIMGLDWGAGRNNAHEVLRSSYRVYWVFITNSYCMYVSMYVCMYVCMIMY